MTVKFHLSHTQMRSQQMPLLGIGTTFKVMSFLHLIGRVLVKIKWDKASIIDIVPCCFLAVVVAISKDGGTQHSVTESAPQTATITRKHPLWIKLQLIVACLSGVYK